MKKAPAKISAALRPAKESVGPAALRYDSAPARRAFILHLLSNTGFCSAAELSRELSVSEMTVRRDIQRLAKEGQARAVHGGVSTITTLMGPIDFRLRAAQRLAPKHAIARHAISLLAANSVVALDAGTTTLEVARLLPPDLRMTIVTHSLPVIGTVASRSNLEVIGLGDALHPDTQAFAGPITLHALSDIRVHTLLLGATSVRDHAMWCTNTFDAATKRALMAAADRVVLLVDSAKFAITAAMKVAPLNEVHTIISDSSITPEARAMCESAGVELIVVKDDDAR